MDKIIVNSPAKINLGLNIVGKREDGFHNLETIFYPLKLSDKITFIKSDKFTFNTNNDFLKLENSNLIIKAKDLLQDESKINLDCDIYLEKNIPIGAGLGGGSSNAAFTLKALNKLFDLNLPIKKLRALALILGSDVPFFLYPVPSFATSRGEITKQTSIKLKGYLVLVNPGIHINTKWAFENLGQLSEEGFLKKTIQKIISGENCFSLISNDFEEIVFDKYLQVKTIKQKLTNMGAYFSLMTGTGSTVYSFFYSRNDAELAREKFPKEFFTYIEAL